MIDVGADLIGVVKTNTKGFFKDTIDNLTNNWPGGSYLVLRSKPIVHGGMPLIGIVYNYNTHKFLPFIVTENSVSTNSGLPYLPKYPDQFSNVVIYPVARPLVLYKLFGYVNEVDSHKKLMQYGLALEKFWVAQCVWIRLCTTVSIIMNINTFWKLFHYEVKRYHYDKLIGIR